MKLCVQSGELVYDVGYEKGYAMIRDAGFEAIDWNIDMYWNTPKVTTGDLSEDCILAHPVEEILEVLQPELDAIRANGLTISQAHAPFPAYTSEFPGLLDYAIDIYKNCILLCQEVGCKNLIVHGITIRAGGGRENIKLQKELNMKLYTSLIPELQKTDVTVCLENLFIGNPLMEGVCSDCYEAVAYIDELNRLAGKKCFGLCLDTGHLNLLRKNMERYIHVLGKRICALHVHDNNADADSHLAPFTGTINWNIFCDSLKAVGYAGDLSFETFNQITLRRRMDEEYIAPYLKMIFEIGVEFKDRILA